MSDNVIYQQRRRDLVKVLQYERITDKRVLDAIGSVPRERFVPDALRERAYENVALEIGSGQTISQPFIVALMTQALRLTGNERILEIGTGSGYQAAVLARLCQTVYNGRTARRALPRCLPDLGSAGNDECALPHRRWHARLARESPL